MRHLSNLSYQALGAYFNPYKAFFNLNTMFSLLGQTKPYGCFIYTSSLRSPFKKTLLHPIDIFSNYFEMIKLL